MNNQVVVQVAETRFAIQCSQPFLARWLMEMRHGFITSGEPHIRFELDIDDTPGTASSGQVLSLRPSVVSYEQGKLRFRIISANPADFSWLILQICLRCALAAKPSPDILMHASGILHDGFAYLFTGASGAGKSTVCRLMAAEPGFSILHDEVIAISRRGENFHAWSPPLRGEMATSLYRGGPLRAIFFLVQDRQNYTVPLSRRKVAELLCYSLIPPLVVKDGIMAAEQGPSLRQILALAGAVGGYELHFRPEPEFWKCVQALFTSKKLITTEKEAVHGHH